MIRGAIFENIKVLTSREFTLESLYFHLQDKEALYIDEYKDNKLTEESDVL